ncbi:hypothetical protein CsSME_00041025 [Camellia sinensis var. sinensis]
MACSAFARPLLKSHSSLLHHQPEKSKTLFSIPFINKPHPVSKTLFHSSPNAQFGLRASKKRNLLAGSTIKSKVNIYIQKLIYFYLNSVSLCGFLRIRNSIESIDIFG